MTTKTTVYRNLGIDSGQLLIVDPCYLRRWTAPSDSELPNIATGTTDYEETSRITIGDIGFGETKIGGFAVGNFGGDVPVEITVTTIDGRVACVHLDFEVEEYEDDEDDEDDEDEDDE